MKIKTDTRYAEFNVACGLIMSTVGKCHIAAPPVGHA